MLNYSKAFSLVEMLVALAVSSIIIIALYTTYDLVATQYKKNLDIANMHTSGRAIMQMIERDVRMAGFEYRHTSGANKGKKAFARSITKEEALSIVDSRNECCDEVKVTYDYFDEDTKAVKRIQIHYFTKEHNTTKKGKRYRIYKQVSDILPTLENRPEEVLGDFIEDFQISKNSNSSGYIYVLSGHGFGGGQFPHGGIYKVDIATRSIVDKISVPSDVCNLKVYGGIRRDPPTSIAIKGNYLYIGYHYRHNSNPCLKIAELNLITGKHRAIYVGSTVDGMTYNPKDGFLYIGRYNGNVRAIDTRDFTTTRGMIWPGYRNQAKGNSIAIGPDGYLYTGRSDGPTVDIWDMTTNNIKQVGELTSYNASYRADTTALAFDSDGNLYSGNNGGIGVGKVYKSPGPWRRFKNDTYNPKYFFSAGLKKGGAGMTFSSGDVRDDSLVYLKLTMRTEKEHSNKNKKYKKSEKKEEHHIGNYKFEFNDKYKHDVFSTAVLIRNLAL